MPDFVIEGTLGEELGIFLDFPEAAPTFILLRTKCL